MPSVVASPAAGRQSHDSSYDGGREADLQRWRANGEDGGGPAAAAATGGYQPVAAAAAATAGMTANWSRRRRIGNGYTAAAADAAGLGPARCEGSGQRAQVATGETGRQPAVVAGWRQRGGGSQLAGAGSAETVASPRHRAVHLAGGVHD